MLSKLSLLWLFVYRNDAVFYLSLLLVFCNLSKVLLQLLMLFFTNCMFLPDAFDVPEMHGESNMYRFVVFLASLVISEG